MIERVEFLDTTLRDGNKPAFIYLASDDRLEMAPQPAQLGVDIIDAGLRSYLDAVNRIEIHWSTRTEEEHYFDGESLWWE